LKRFFRARRLKKIEKKIFYVLAAVVIIAVFEAVSLIIKLLNSDDSAKFLLLILLIINVPLLRKLYEYIKTRKFFTEEKIRIGSDMVALDELHHLTPHEFELWAAKFLKMLGYSDIQITELGPDGGKDIICRKEEDEPLRTLESKRALLRDAADGGWLLVFEHDHATRLGRAVWSGSNVVLSDPVTAAAN
jgi:HJR/Mrr/RecB family endonuclease